MSETKSFSLINYTLECMKLYSQLPTDCKKDMLKICKSYNFIWYKLSGDPDNYIKFESNDGKHYGLRKKIITSSDGHRRAFFNKLEDLECLDVGGHSINLFINWLEYNIDCLLVIIEEIGIVNITSNAQFFSAHEIVRDLRKLARCFCIPELIYLCFAFDYRLVEYSQKDIPREHKKFADSVLR